ncbi:MAG: type IV secretory pathway, VirB11 component and related ATPase involved in archaeal flagella biosynthesis [Candidatus Nanosalina sp. J07AB43]|nr:MAG: type IV secretory pathway, VirB11 component and related ATPase involved in archaeal flagella biosynthesis [Candidatus Nanosalina sp. J07AB43]
MSPPLNNLVGKMRKMKHPELFEDEEEDQEEDLGPGVELPTPGEFTEEVVEEAEEEEDLTDVDISYPLVPEDPDEGETVYAWAHITWNDEEGELVYRIVEPELGEDMKETYSRIVEIMERSFDINFDELEAGQAKEYLEDKIDMIVDKYNISIPEEKREVIRYYTKRDFAGLGKLQPLMNDTEVEDISCDGLGVPIYAYHRNPRFGSIKTNLEWNDSDHLDSFVMKLAQRCGKSISVSSPLLDGSLPDGSRVQATLATDIARHGSNFTIRRFSEDPLTPIHMMDYETENARMLAYLWMIVEHEKSMLVSGTTGAGKTSQLNSMSLFIRPEKKIVSIEDTPELRLPHEHWVPEVSRSGFGSSAGEGGEVTMDNLLKESLRQRPEYIIVGEVRGAEAYILFQQMATGHTGLSTIHADSLDMLMDRLTTEPINLSPSLIETLDLIMVIARIRRGGTYIRRIMGLYEIRGYDKRKGIDANQVFGWNPDNDEYVVKNNSMILKDIADQAGKEYSEIRKELRNRQHVLNWMQEEQIKNYRKVGDIISRYYSDPESILKKVGQTFNSEQAEKDTDGS